MRMRLKISILCCLGAMVWRTMSAEQTAVVTEQKINVRGQPSLIGEVVTQLQKGDTVTVLEDVSLEKPKPGEPTNWAKIKLPANTPVWVFSSLIKDGVVTGRSRGELQCAGKTRAWRQGQTDPLRGRVDRD
jgi:uncharacterized protein YgiM (DUF1202 family)